MEKISSAVGKASGLLLFLFCPSSPPVYAEGKKQKKKKFKKKEAATLAGQQYSFQSAKQASHEI